MAKFLVTGAAGFIGAAVVRALAARGDAVAALDLVSSAPLAATCSHHANAVFYAGSITEWPHLAQTVRDFQPEAIIHCAALVGLVAAVLAPAETMRVNIGGSLNVLEVARLYRVPRVINLSSEEIYGPIEPDRIDETYRCRPTLPYGISKFAVEQLARDYRDLYGVETAHLRTCWVYGPGLPRPRVPKNLIDAALAGRALHLDGGAEFIVDQIYIDDLVAGIVAAADCPTYHHDSYHISSGEGLPLAESVSIVNDLVPSARLSIGSGPYKLSEQVTVVKKAALDYGRAQRDFGYKPRYSLRQGLAAYLAASRAA
jgi:nucleoside-diphosphate-sugar epimerase